MHRLQRLTRPVAEKQALVGKGGLYTLLRAMTLEFLVGGQSMRIYASCCVAFSASSRVRTTRSLPLKFDI
jgi:hypothetical protein